MFIEFFWIMPSKTLKCLLVCKESISLIAVQEVSNVAIVIGELSKMKTKIANTTKYLRVYIVPLANTYLRIFQEYMKIFWVILNLRKEGLECCFLFDIILNPASDISIIDGLIGKNVME